MSECRLLLELGSSHHREQRELFIIGSSGQACLWILEMTHFLLDSLSPETITVPSIVLRVPHGCRVQA
jgi:hypothetical protein